MKKLMKAAAALALVLTAGCSAQQPAETPAEEPVEEEVVTVRVGSLKGPTSLGLLNMMNSAEEKATEGSYEFTILTAADEMAANVVQGNVDIALVPANLASVLYKKTEGKVTVIDINTLGVLYCVSADDSITGVKDLSGRTVVTTGQGTTPEFSLRYLLKEYGVEDCNIEFKSEATEVVIASEYRYRSFHLPKDSVALIVSQSGETADTLACLREIKKRGVKTLGIVNVVGSTIAREVNGGTYVHAGPEISVASTKAFTAQVVTMLMFAGMIAEYHGGNPDLIHSFTKELSILPEEIEKNLNAHHDEVKELAKKYAKFDDALYLGRDTAYPIALEGALKLKEISYIHAEGYASGELKHGPIALIDDRFFEVFNILDNWLFDKSIGGLHEVRARGGKVIVLTNSEAEIEADDIIRIKSDVKLLAPILLNTLQQLFAYYVAVERGNDVDQPRNLAKSVTVE